MVRGLTKTSIPTTARRFSGGVDLALRRHRGMFSNRAQRIPGQLRERSSKKVRPCALCQPRDELRLDLGVLPLPPTRGSADTRSDSGDQQCRPCHTKLSRQKSDGTCTRPLRALVWVRHHSVDCDLEIESRALKIAALLERPRSPTRPQIRHRMSPSSSRPQSRPIRQRHSHAVLQDPESATHASALRITHATKRQRRYPTLPAIAPLRSHCPPQGRRVCRGTARACSHR